MNETAPACLCDSLQQYPIDNISQNMSCAQQLKSYWLFQTKTATYGDRAFPVAGPKKLEQIIILRETQTLNSFKNGLKTFLFGEAFFYEYRLNLYFVHIEYCFNLYCLYLYL